MVKSRPRVLLLSGYDAASHRRWREQITALLEDYEWHTLVLPPRYFSWRIRGNALSWLDEPLLQQDWDLVLATSMVDLAGLRSFNPSLARVPCLLYMHENQFAFPDSGKQLSSLEPQMINLYSALSADRVAFNSAWNRDSFLSGVGVLLDRMPDCVPGGIVERLRTKAAVLPVPIEDRLFVDSSRPASRGIPHLLWNHRWEYDKGPERLLKLLEVLAQEKFAFRLSVVGEQFRSRPPVFDQIHARFSGSIEHWGFLECREEYDALLHQADFVISTALHDFQGLAILEAMAAGCQALVPDRLAYREYVPHLNRYESHEADAESEARGAAWRLQELVARKQPFYKPEAWRASSLARDYRSLLDSLILKGRER
ncbi:tRNA-queuosine alpha-mannosyltransferase domain-containing protein [Marinobacter salicampi]|uniref:tRNA-queuosine alpha-mannosyltransferase domain-containing protein n=1 Tax=Marinobacter salicampi TaxID=435907 RepID=UPI0014084F4B|nr:DUF3524 domain-containing protein [Marinobacter salicampi]